MTRRTGLSLAVVVGLVAVGLVALVLFRAELAAAALRSGLAALGVPAVALTVEAIDLDSVRVADLALGRKGEVRAQEIAARFRIGGLIAGRFDEITVDGLVVRLDLGGEAPPLGSLQPLLVGGKGGATPGGLGRIPPITIRNARVEAATPAGPLALTFDGEVRGDDEGGAIASASFRLQSSNGAFDGAAGVSVRRGATLTGGVVLDEGMLTLPGVEAIGLVGEADFAVRSGRLDSARAAFTVDTATLFGIPIHGGDLTVELTPDRAVLAGELRAPERTATATCHLAVDDYASAPRIDATCGLEAAAKAPLWRVFDLPRPSAGRGVVEVRGGGRLPIPDAWPTSLGAMLEWFGRSELDGRLSVRLEDVSYGDRIAGLTAGLEAGFARAVGGGAVTGEGRIAAELAELRLGGAVANDIGVRLPVAFEIGDAGLETRLGKSGTLTIAGAAYGGLAALSRPLELAIREGTSLAIGATAGGGRSVRHDLRLAPAEIALAVSREGGAPIDLVLSPGAVRLEGRFADAGGYRGTAKLAGGRLAARELGIAVEEVAMRAAFGSSTDGLSVEIDDAVLRHRGRPPLVAPLRLSGRLSGANDLLTLAAEGRDPGGVRRFTAAARHDTRRGRGEARLDLGPFEFAPDGLQPGRLFPILGDLRRAAGRASASARVAWNADGFESGGVAELDELTFESGDVAVEGLTARIDFDGLLPPSTPDGQVVTIRRLDPGLPLEDLSVRFRLLPGESPRLFIKDGGFGFAGGRVRVRDTMIDPAAPRQTVDFEVEGIDLGRLFELVRVEGLSGSGILNGVFPVERTERGFVIRDGRLAAAGPGVLRFRSETAAAALERGGEAVDLMLRALRDFRYDKLDLTAEKDLAGEARVTLRLEGRNPQVLEGRPFAFNVNLSGSFDRILAAVRRGGRLTSDLLRGRLGG